MRLHSGAPDLGRYGQYATMLLFTSTNTAYNSRSLVFSYFRFQPEPESIDVHPPALTFTVDPVTPNNTMSFFANHPI